MIRKTDKPRGILLQAPAKGDVLHERYHPSPDMAFFIEHFWTVRWNLEGLPPMRVETLPHPTVHLVLEKGSSKIGGVAEGKFSRTLEGNSFVFSVKFRPGAFYCFYKKPISNLTNKTIQPAEFFGKDFSMLETKILEASSNEEMFRLTEDFLRNIRPAEDENVEEINTLLQKIILDRSLTRVEQLLAFSGKNMRSLQRLFRLYLGVSPKWVIARYRIHEALERLNENKAGDWAGLAFDLGYADQAHFIRDFKKLVGKTPTVYMKVRSPEFKVRT